MSKSSEVEARSSVVEDWGELTPEEEQELHRLELRVERAFCEAGTALREIRDKRLYRSTHRTFEEYCRDRFGFNRMAAHFKIAAATVFENLYTNGIQTLPTSERQVRELAAIDPVVQCSVWQSAVEQAGGKVPSGRIVKGIVERLKEKPLRTARDFCSLGDVFTLIRLEGDERKYNGCWAIAFDVSGINVKIDVHDTALTVKPENLKPIDEPDVSRQLPQTLKRIRRLRNVGLLDRSAYNVLEDLGRQIYLTELEEKLLRFLEKEYGIES